MPRKPRFCNTGRSCQKACCSPARPNEDLEVEECRVEDDAFELVATFMRKPEMNRLLSDLAQKTERNLIHITCPSPDTFKKLCEEEETLEDVQAEVAVMTLEDVHEIIEMSTYSPQRSMFWEVATEQTEKYDPVHEISVALGTPLPDGRCFALPFVVPRLGD